MIRYRVDKLILLESLVFFCVCVALPMAYPSAAQTAASSDSTTATTPAPAIQFDVVSIKLNKSGESRMSHSFPPDGDSMSFTNVTLFMVMMYSFNSDRPGMTIGLPGWTKTDRYDISVKVTGPDVAEYLKLDQAQRKLMLQKVLADRFKLQLHREAKPMPVYELVVAQNGPKMQSAKSADIPANGRTIFFSGPGKLSGQGATTEDLASALSDSGMDRRVLNKTGIDGRFNFLLHFTMNQSADSEPGGSPDNSAAGEKEPSIFTAVQEQLGLKLEPDTAPVECLVIDHVQRPSEN